MERDLGLTEDDISFNHPNYGIEEGQNIPELGIVPTPKEEGYIIIDGRIIIVPNLGISKKNKRPPKGSPLDKTPFGKDDITIRIH